MKLVAILSFWFIAAAADSSPDIQPIPNGISGDGITTRYWDCCAPSCAYYGFISTQNGIPDQTCQIDGETPSTEENNAKSGCEEGGTAFTCSIQQPFVVNSTLAYGWTAASFTGGVDTSKCCHCLLLSFKDQLAGKQMLVQIVNTGSDLGENQFDLQIPGGGVGIFNLGCMTQWNTGEDGWGRRYGGVSTIEECDTLPAVLQPGCRFRFEYMEGVDNPLVSFIEVKCPAELVNISKCGDL
ncbi:endoglucanase-like [Diorhabda carinulata]|uniref:endoglucanase-like n=1 Tax=Diorhabda carinulata TaxID=1163345 RepID=UPI0025A23D9E|nr:endoglucanase-like [Diorhabda carinulata]